MTIGARHSRREMLRLSAGALLALGLWPGAVRAAGAGHSGRFHFVVVNDVHQTTDASCGPWLERVLDRIRAGPRPELCLLAGDQSDHGTVEELTAVQAAFARLGVPVFPVIGNHDYLKQTDRSGYEKVFPNRLNYHFEHRGWLFVGLDTTFGLKASKTHVQPATLEWLDRHLPRLDRQAPLVVFTHFPLGERVTNRPLNADEVLARFREHNLQYVFSGHFHAATERRVGATTLVTNRCCSITRPNHDKTTEKGYFLCEARDGTIHREFEPVDTKGLGPAPKSDRAPAGT